MPAVCALGTLLERAPGESTAPDVLAVSVPAAAETLKMLEHP